MIRSFHKYRVSDLIDYINWSYFYYAWSVNGSDTAHADAAARLRDEADQMLKKLERYVTVRAVILLAPAYSDGDDIVIVTDDARGEVRLPMLRQQVPGKDGYCRCLSDFIRPMELGKAADMVGLFACSVNADPKKLFPEDEYMQMMVQTLADRLAEAAAERFHQEVRTSVWGYASDENLTIEELHRERYKGIRPAVGYPCLPDLSINFLLCDLCDYGRIGVRLTEHGMMQPHASVSGLMISHPAAEYFSVGRISNDQLVDYAARRQMSPDKMRTYLAANM